MTKIFLDGAYLDEKDAKLSVSDRGLLMGDGVFVTIQVNKGEPFFLERHLQKLQEQAKKLFLSPPEVTEERISKLIELNEAFEGVWRLKIYYTAGLDTAMRLPSGRRGSLIMILKPYTVPPYGPLRLCVYPTPVMAPQSSLKSLSHISRYMIMEYALQQGYDDAITVTEGGMVLETAFGNIFWVVDNELYTPSAELPLHFGVTISVILDMAKLFECSCHFIKSSLSQIPQNAFVYRCNTMGGIRPITQIGQKQWARNVILEKRLLEEYEKQTLEALVTNLP